MKKTATILMLFLVVVLNSCKNQEPESFILIPGGTFINPNSNYFGSGITVNEFYLGSREITQKEWLGVMDSNPSKQIGDNYPVEMVSWYDCILYCNIRSEKEGLTPYYNIIKDEKDLENHSIYDDVKWKVTINEAANGYRLPTEIEWEYAASGGNISKGFNYSGNNDLLEIAWFWRNTGDKFLDGDWHWTTIENNNSKTKPVGKKKPNEFGLFDMSGNVREWCWDWYEDMDLNIGHYRVWRGGGWIGGEHTCSISYRGLFEANGIGPDQGFRVAKNALTIQKND
jgi:formylglycine-generating enzyme